MSCLEHLIENTVALYEQGKEWDEIIEAIKRDPNFPDAGISAEACCEICQQIYCDYMHYGWVDEAASVIGCDPDDLFDLIDALKEVFSNSGNYNLEHNWIDTCCSWSPEQKQALIKWADKVKKE